MLRVLGPDDLFTCTRLGSFFSHPQRRAAEAWFGSETRGSASRVFWGYVGVLLCGTCGAPRVIAPWRGVSVSGSLSRIRLHAGTLTCARTDGVGVSSGGRDVNTRCPLARPLGGSPPMSARPRGPRRLGGRPPSRVHIWVSPHSLILAVSQLSACMCLQCAARFGCERVRGVDLHVLSLRFTCWCVVNERVGVDRQDTPW